MFSNSCLHSKRYVHVEYHDLTIVIIQILLTTNWGGFELRVSSLLDLFRVGIHTESSHFLYGLVSSHAIIFEIQLHTYGSSGFPIGFCG